MSHPVAENMTGIASIFSYANTVSDNIFGVGTLIVFYLVVASYLHFNRQEEFSDCMVVGGFLTNLAAILFFLVGLINNWQFFMIFVMFALSSVWAFSRKSG